MESKLTQILTKNIQEKNDEIKYKFSQFFLQNLQVFKFNLHFLYCN